MWQEARNANLQNQSVGGRAESINYLDWKGEVILFSFNLNSFNPHIFSPGRNSTLKNQTIPQYFLSYVTIVFQ